MVEDGEVDAVTRPDVNDDSGARQDAVIDVGVVDDDPA
jgi:hypothetical protein